MEEERTLGVCEVHQLELTRWFWQFLQGASSMLALHAEAHSHRLAWMAACGCHVHIHPMFGHDCRNTVLVPVDSRRGHGTDAQVAWLPVCERYLFSTGVT